MADLTVKLGDFVFQDAEVPEQIPFGGDQHIAIHNLVGGAREIDAMGRSDEPLQWSGLFQGQNAVRRAKYLDSLRVAGAPLKLTWHEFSYMVVIRSFRAVFQRYYRISYSITCEVIVDLSKPVTTKTAPGLLATIQADLNAINTLVGLIADNPLTQAVQQFAAAVSLLPGGSRISRAMQQKLLFPLQNAQQRTSVLIGSTNSVLQAGSNVASAASLTSQMANMQQMSNLVSLNGLLGRSGSNIGAATGGTNIVTVGGGNLYDLAAKQYGDPTQWTNIAAANGLTDPVISGTKNLVCPAVPDLNSGILNF